MPREHPRTDTARPFAALFALAMLALVATGCGPSVFEYQDAYRRDLLLEADEKTERLIEYKGNGRDAALVYLEAGTLKRALGQYEQSSSYFERAAETFDEIDQEAQVRVSQEALSIAVNQREMQYTGTGYDRIMLHVMRALNEMCLGDYDSARPALTAAFFAQQEAVRRNARRIERLHEEQHRASAQNQTVDFDAVRGSDKVQAEVAATLADLDEFQAYGLYVVPFAEFLQGLYSLHRPADASDLDNARLSFERTAGMIGDENPYITGDLDLAQRAVRGDTNYPELTYVLFETGTAPELVEKRVDIPLFFFNDTVDYFGIAYPILEFDQNYVSDLIVRAGEHTYHTHMLTDMDAVIAEDFRNRFDEILTRAIVSSVSKAAVATAANVATRNDALLNAATRVSTTIYQYATNRADTRTWETLPKQIQYARFPTPADRRITLVAPGGGQEQITLEPGATNVVLVRSIRPGSPLRTCQFVLR